MKGRATPVFVATAVALTVVFSLAVVDYLSVGGRLPVHEMIRPWSAILGSALVGAVISGLLLLNVRRLRGGIVIVPCVITALLAFSMWPIHALINHGFPPELGLVCPSP